MKRFLVYLSLVLLISMSSSDPTAAREISYSFHSDSQADGLLQFKAGGHILGFTPQRMYMVGKGYALVEEFVGAKAVTPYVHGQLEETRDTARRVKEALPLREVTYRHLWKGITLKYRCAERGVGESVFFIEPRADTTQIKIRYMAEIKIQQDGRLKLELPTKGGHFTLTAPVAWQEVEGKREKVEVSFKKYDERTLGFQVGKYNPDYGLTIDPTYRWHTFYGSTAFDSGDAVVLDSMNNVYVTGSSSATWNGDGSAPPIHAHSGAQDVFILKLNSAGTYQWHTFYGSGFGMVNGGGIAFDSANNVYVRGNSYDAWNGDGGAAPINAHSGEADAFVLKLNSAGIYQWHTFYGSTDSDFGVGIYLDQMDNVYVTGSSYATWNGDGGIAPLHTHSGGADIFVLQLTGDGKYQWHTFYGSTTDDFGYSLIFNADDNVYVTGTSYAAWSGEYGIAPIHSHSGDSNVFILHITNKGKYQWHTFYRGASTESSSGIAVDSNDDLYVTGFSYATWNGDSGELPIHAYSGGKDILILHITKNGKYQWHSFYGATDDDYGNGIYLDSKDNIYVAGWSFITWNGDGGVAPIHAHTGFCDLFILQITKYGGYLRHSFYGSTNWDYALEVKLDSMDSVYIAGQSGFEWNGDGGRTPLHAYTGGHDVTILKLTPLWRSYALPWLFQILD